MKRSFFEIVKCFIGKKLLLGNFGIYNSFGVNHFFYPKPSKKNIIKTNKIHKKFLKEKNSREKILNFKIDNILFGDLLYDCYLKKHYDVEPTIYLNDKKFIKI